MDSRTSNDRRRSTVVNVVKRSVAHDCLMILGFMSGISECVETVVVICGSAQCRVDQSTWSTSQTKPQRAHRQYHSQAFSSLKCKKFLRDFWGVTPLPP